MILLRRIARIVGLVVSRSERLPMLDALERSRKGLVRTKRKHSIAPAEYRDSFFVLGVKGEEGASTQPWRRV